jgi:hypothetical protein
MSKLIDERAVMIGLDEYNAKVMAEEIDEIMKRCCPKDDGADERLPVTSLADQALLDYHCPQKER